MAGLSEELKKIAPKLKLEEKYQDQLYSEIAQEDFMQTMKAFAEKQFQLISLFCVEKFEGQQGYCLLYAFEKQVYPEILVLKRRISSKASSIALLFPSACWYEREIQDGFGILFEDLFDSRRLFLHEAFPKDFYPLRKNTENKLPPLLQRIPLEQEYQFKQVHGEGVYHIPVGPVHAGIIEPGHFRFSVIGETIFNLEVRMFWKHRGIEKLAEGKSLEFGLQLAQAISGDESVANALAFCEAAEKICKASIPPKAQHLRVLFAEMERIYSLLGDLAGMIIDVAYPAGASQFFILREEMMRLNERVSDSRFLKNAIVLGGVKKDIPMDMLNDLKSYLDGFMPRFNDATEHAINSAGILDRFETTGIVKKELVWPLHLSGPLARASGVACDVRLDHPYSIYPDFVPSPLILDEGDVLARFKVKAATIKNSVDLIAKIIKTMPLGDINSKYVPKDGYALSLVESCRGQNMHWLYVENGVISRYKIRGASFNNWQAIEHAVLGNIVPDFPLVNKSMNLSYAGTDL